MSRFALPTRNVVRFSGEDARKLLNDTLTCRFDEGLIGVGRWFALLSPQGKVQVEGLLTEADGAFWVDLQTQLVADFVKRMKLYRLRAKVDIEPLPAYSVLWSPDGDMPADESAIAYHDGRSPELGIRYIVSNDMDATPAQPDADPIATYNTARIAAGILEFGADFAVNEVFPHDIGMDFLNGVDFKKGCYIGQEVVSRMQHRGTARRRPVIVTGVPDGAAAGAPVLVGEREAGAIGTPQDGKAVAIIRLDRIDESVEPTIGGLPVSLTIPTWASYKFGGTEAEA